MAKGKKRPEVYRVEAYGDTVYINARTKGAAEIILRRHMGAIPDSILTWSDGPVPLPLGEEALA